MPITDVSQILQVVNAFAILSTLSLFCIFLRVSWLGILRVLGENVAQTLFNTQLGYYAACLLIANMINGIAGLLGLPFLVNRAITDTAVMQVGNIATAYFTVAIAFHTFNSLVLRKRQSIYVYGPTILLGWVVSLVLGIADALLLFNTFRVLSPAFEAKSASGGQADLESFGTAETFKRRFSLGSQGPLQLNLTEAMIKEYRGTSLSSPSSYNASSTVSYPERAASAQSSYRHATAEEVNRQISPVSILNESIVVEAPGSMIASRPPARVSNVDHIRQESQSSTTSLPIPPRRTPPPSHLIIDHPSTSSLSSPSSVAPSSLSRPVPARPSLSPRNVALSSSARSFSPQKERARVSEASTSSLTSEDLDVTSWLANQNANGYMPTGLRNQPMLSAVRPNFPSTVAPMNIPASPAARLRPLLLASVERTGSMILAEHYNRMYSPHSS
ncbi:hypothetical protein HHX47_DHR7000286 [Lentinula edodes]|nr:hypothetical protein HHX47_DHR7000286 [Lentinula edodes]